MNAYIQALDDMNAQLLKAIANRDWDEVSKIANEYQRKAMQASNVLKTSDDSERPQVTVLDRVEGHRKSNKTSDNFDKPQVQVLDGVEGQHKSNKAAMSLKPEIVESLLFWEIDADNNGGIDMQECQTFAAKPRCHECLSSLFNSSNDTLSSRLCTDLGIGNSPVSRRGFIAALQSVRQSQNSSDLMQDRTTELYEDEELDEHEEHWFTCW